MYVHIIVVITYRGRAVTNVGRTCGPTPLLAIYAIKYVYTTYTTHKDRSICIIGIDLSHIGVPIPHIRIDLSALLG